MPPPNVVPPAPAERPYPIAGALSVVVASGVAQVTVVVPGTLLSVVQGPPTANADRITPAGAAMESAITKPTVLAAQIPVAPRPAVCAHDSSPAELLRHPSSPIFLTT